MNAPFTASYADAFVIAEASLAAVLTAVVWRRPVGGRIGSALFTSAVWLVALLPTIVAVLEAFGFRADPELRALHLMQLASALVVASTLFVRPRWVVVGALATAAGLYWTDGRVADFADELKTVHLFAFAAVLGLVHRFSPARADRAAVAVRSHLPHARPLHDVLIFGAGTALGVVSCLVVLEAFVNSGDEWANTYQADLFGHLRAYATAPPCPNLFRNYWVFFYMGKAFAQYTPGWPLVMAPFQRLGIVWLASPLVLGLTAVGIARLARRIAAYDPHADGAQISAAGVLASLSAMFGASVVLNAGSRYPHLFVAACFAWAVESMCAAADSMAARRDRVKAGFVLGTACAFGLATRPGDGAVIGLGIFFAFVYGLARRRLTIGAVLATVVAFSVWALVMLVILRLQLGEWLKTGYSIAGQYFSWAQPKFSLPHANELHFALPLASASYCWWPAAPALGVLGLMQARGRSSMAAFILALDCAAMLTFYVLVELGRGAYNPGYGPRFILPTVVAMAVGGGVALAPLWRDATRTTQWRSALAAAGPAVLAMAALASGTLRIAPLIYPAAHAEVHLRGATFRAIKAARLRNAVVTANGSDVAFDPMDMAQNLPTLEDPDVLIFVDGGFSGPDDMRCGHKHYGDRTWYRAVGKTDDVKLEPR